MIKVNEYFNGKVKSLAFHTQETNATIGVIQKGEYEFGTSQKEIMHIIKGKLSVLLPGESIWEEYTENQSFVVEKNQQFKVKTDSDTAYLCLYY